MLTFDEVGYWSEVKLDIVREYATAYSKILSTQRNPRLHHVYIDGFAGAGVHLSKSTGDFIAGSPLNALQVQPPFRQIYLVDLSAQRVDQLRGLAGDRDNVILKQGDCNRVLVNEVFPQVKWEQYRRGLCLLDPYGMHLDWKVMETAGKARSIDLFLNFPTMDINMNALRRDGKGSDEGEARLTAFWGDESWKAVAFAESKQTDLFGKPATVKVATNDGFVAAFRQRLKKVAGFKHVLDPMPMRNTAGRIVYYLFFASQKAVAHDIAKAIFAKHASKGS